MSFILICLALFFVLIVIFWFSTIYLEVDFLHNREKNRADIYISLWFPWLRLHFAIPKINWKGMEKEVEIEVDSQIQEEEILLNEEKIEQFKEWLDKLIDPMIHVRRFLKRVHCQCFNWKTVFGTGDAMETGIIAGIVWMIKSNLLAFLYSILQWDNKPKLEVLPVFSQPELEISFHSIVRFRMGHAIIATTSLLLQKRTRRNAKWPNIPFKA